jgi:hypothetical protein
LSSKNPFLFYFKEIKNKNSFLNRLFVNHRPAYSIVKSQIDEALKEICQQEEIKGPLTKERFLEILQKEGEKMSYDDIKSK